jgi:hypothetical protein
MTTVDPSDRFKWDILHDAVFEDLQGLWEPLWWLRGGGAIEGQSEAQRQDFAERALRHLYHEGLIFFFRVPAWADIGASAENQDLRLGLDEVNDTLVATWWRGRQLPPDHPNIWWGPTPAGEAAVNDPPDQIRAVWDWPPRSS